MSVEDQDLLLDALAADYRVAGLEPADRSMLDYAVKLTESPNAVTSGDVDRLRDLGFDDRGIHDICSITAYFAFVNRIAEGLGVELEGTASDPA
ncbi:MAG: peroxidase [Acidobacteria bacterium]|nr:peroxidase [Acidobacteriota bacterium]